MSTVPAASRRPRPVRGPGRRGRTARRLAAATLTGVAALGAGVLAPLVAPAPASADVSGSTSSADVVLYDRCQSHTVDYSLAVSPGTSFWQVDIQVFDPTGKTSEGSYLSSNLGQPLKGSVMTTPFCGSETPGTYTVHAVGSYQVIPGINIPVSATSLPDSTFTVRRAETRTALTSHRLRHGRTRLVAAVTEERPEGFTTLNGATVKIQRLVDGTWRPVRGSKHQTFHGRTHAIVRVARGTTYRAVTTGIGNYTGSTSAPTRTR